MDSSPSSSSSWCRPRGLWCLLVTEIEMLSMVGQCGNDLKLVNRSKFQKFKFETLILFFMLNRRKGKIANHTEAETARKLLLSETVCTNDHLAMRLERTFQQGQDNTAEQAVLPPALGGSVILHSRFLGFWLSALQP